MSEAKFTKGPLRIGVIEENADKWISENLSYGSGDVWLVFAPDHPLHVTGADPQRPEHVVTTAITGNGPTSEANAYLYAAAPQLYAACEEALGSIEFMMREWDSGIDFTDDDGTVAKLRAALAAARGEKP
jgi:hypothetical protein